MLTFIAGIAMMRPLVIAHYMPWYQSKTIGGSWGWHWTMNHFNPDQKGLDGSRQLASKYHPTIGPYDSSDPDCLECQTLQMKIAGIDGVLIDWYGTKDLYDYPALNRNTGKMIGACTRAGLKFAIVLEDQIVPVLVKAGKSTPEEYAKSALAWLDKEWFHLPGYLKWKHEPVLLIFGPQYYKEADLKANFGNGVALFTELGRQGPAVGAFGWPEPQVGHEQSWTKLREFYERSKDWSASIPVVYPRFEDVYKEAGVSPGYGEIRDDEGKTFERSLKLAEESGASFLQIATWNDWGEGTQIEPSQEFGYRDLERLQTDRRASDPGFPFRASDLRLPERIYRLRKAGFASKTLDQAVQALLDGHPVRAAKLVDDMRPGHG